MWLVKLGVSPVGVSPIGGSPNGVSPNGVSPNGVSPNDTSVQMGVVQLGVVQLGVVQLGSVQMGVDRSKLIPIRQELLALYSLAASKLNVILSRPEFESWIIFCSVTLLVQSLMSSFY